MGKISSGGRTVNGLVEYRQLREEYLAYLESRKKRPPTMSEQTR